MAADPGASAGIWQDMGLPTAHGFSSGPSWDGPWQAPAHNCQTQCPTVLWRKIWIDTILDCGPWPCTDFFALGWAPTLPQNTFWRTAMLIASKPNWELGGVFPRTGKIGKSPQFYILCFPCPLRSQQLQEQHWRPLMTQVEYAKSMWKVTLTDTVHGIATERQRVSHTIWLWAKFLRYNCHVQKLFKKVLPILAYPHVSLYACSLPASGDFGMSYNMFSWFLYVLLGPCCWNKEAQKYSGSKTDANLLLFHSGWSLAGRQFHEFIS